MPDDFDYSASDITAAERQLATDLRYGIRETDIDGRRVSRHSLRERYEIMQEMSADLSSESDGGILKPKFKAAD